MARNRTIYQSKSIYAGPSPATGVHFANTPGGGIYGTRASQISGTNRVKELLRVQSINYSYNIARQDINQFNQLSAIDRVILEPPTVSVDFNYILQGVSNEHILGFTISSGAHVSAISGILNKTQDERNYFIATVPEGNDEAGYTLEQAPGNVNVIAIGNGFISSYSTEGSVGNFPTASVTVEGLNIKLDPMATGNVIPAVNPASGTTIDGWFYSLPTGKQSHDSSTINTSDYSISALRPGDIQLSLGTERFGPQFSDLKVQNYTLSFDLTREPLQKLGSKYAFSREIQFPVTVSLTVTAEVGDVVSGNLVDVINNDANITYNPIITINKPNSTTVAARYELRGAKLDSMEVSNSIGPNESATFTFSSQLGGPQNVTNGLFISGINYYQTITY